MAADVLRLAAFGALAFVPSLGLMIACALVAGIGTALFNPSALASLSQVAKPEHRPAAMSLYAVLDDIGLTLGPALAGALLIVFEPHTLMAVNAVTFTISAVLLVTIPLNAPIARASTSLLASLRSGAREIAARPGVKLLLASSTVAVVAVGMVNVGEVILAREMLGVGGSGLAALMTASGIGTFVGSTFGARTGTTWQWRKAYMLGLVCMAADLILCAVAPSSGSCSRRSRSAASATASRSCTTGCCWPTRCPRRCTGGCSRCTRPAPRPPSCSPSWARAS